MLNAKKLEQYLDAGFNVLLEGSHGLGKTAIIKEVFEKKGLNWKYFSASTMDPWIDFIGVPKTVKDAQGQDFLELVKPREFANDEVEAIFFDEFNRAPAKVINAVMELIQFKSINGKKFNKLKVIWAAINPHDENGTYSVEQIDPATKDRFHIQIKIPLELDSSYLIKTHGELSKPFIKWWNELPAELKQQISPRRLDYAIQVHKAKGDLRDVLLSESNVKKLEHYIIEMHKGMHLSDLLKKSDKELQEFFTLENTIKYGEKILSEKKYEHLIQYFNKDFVESNIQKNDGSKFNKLLIEKALVNTRFYDDLSQRSKQIIEQTKQSGGLIKNAHVAHSMEQLIVQTLENSITKSLPYLIGKLEPVFSTFCLNLKQQKSTDIVSFFDLLFNSKDSKGLEMQERLLKSLSTIRTISQYKPKTDSQKIFLGFMLNFAFKYATLNKSSNLKALKQTISFIYSHYVKKRNGYMDSCKEILISFEEINWPIFKEILQKNGDLSKAPNSMKVKELFAQLKLRKDTTLSFVPPDTIEQAQDIFSKEQIKIVKFNVLEFVENLEAQSV